MTPIPPTVLTLRDLVRWLAATYHRGSVNAIKTRVKGLSPALIAKWSNGYVQYPRLESLAMLADAYGLDRNEVLARAYPKMRPPTPIAGGSPASDKTRYGKPGSVLQLAEYMRHYVKFLVLLLRGSRTFGWVDLAA